ncbi:NAD(P)H-hydrate epimerase [Microbacterium sp.]|uniref:NAD(P)H-hydrate epimerase n=1 Tax=Microbacterium sp. TaxID=51671 RepID=UPI0028120BEA|nr:NAD(P)H-hydrate epimerase [Microbacterium sp.]
MFAAAEVAANGTEVDVLRTADRVHDEALAAATDAGATLIELGDVDAAAYDLVVDGILGIGARGGLRGRAREVVSTLMPATPRVIAVDLPSGLDPDLGDAGDIVLPATTTVTFGAVKAGLTRGEGPALSGRVVLVRLGLELADAVGEASVDEIR